MTNERELERIRQAYYEPLEDNSVSFEPLGHILECLECRTPLYVGEEAYTVAGEWYCSEDCAEIREWDKSDLIITEVVL